MSGEPVTDAERERRLRIDEIQPAVEADPHYAATEIVKLEGRTAELAEALEECVGVIEQIATQSFVRFDAKTLLERSHAVLARVRSEQ